MGNYSLQKYKGTATRHTCPKCGDRHSFVYYVDENNVPLHPSVGRCNHESGCGYHYTPKEYFQEHPEHRTTNDFSFDRQRAEQKKVKQQSKPTAIGYILPFPLHTPYFLLWRQGERGVEAVVGGIPFGGYP